MYLLVGCSEQPQNASSNEQKTDSSAQSANRSSSTVSDSDSVKAQKPEGSVSGGQ